MTSFHARFDELAEWFETLTPASLQSIANVYAQSATFRDPFNDLRGVASVRQVYQHMFETLVEPRFVITSKLIESASAFMTWRFLFTSRGKAYVIEGSTHFVLDEQGLIAIHRDYWDAAQELYEKIPVLGAVLRGLRRKLSIPNA
ncbi:MAG: nuclear transport factor 2 family protein [Alcaligenaceae bacterium]|nr:nuclear transport factor 2 family protein [Alcaligenaceae bacterium]